MRDASLGRWHPYQPIDETAKFGSRCGGHVLQVGLVQAMIPGSPQPENTNSLRDGALDPCPPPVSSGELLRVLALSCCGLD